MEVCCYSNSVAEKKVHFMTFHIVFSFCFFLFAVLKEINRLFEQFPINWYFEICQKKKVTHRRLRYLTSKSNEVVKENT